MEGECGAEGGESIVGEEKEEGGLVWKTKEEVCEGSLVLDNKIDHYIQTTKGYIAVLMPPMVERDNIEEHNTLKMQKEGCGEKKSGNRVEESEEDIEDFEGGGI